jgi:hypothetical protein
MKTYLIVSEMVEESRYLHGFESYPKRIKAQLMFLRRLILDTAASIEVDGGKE